MGAPTSGQLLMSNGMTREMCNPSIVWSDDSEFLAVPQWTTGRTQRLMVISIQHRTSRYVDDEFRVLELHDFSNGIVRGIDSPIYMPQSFAFDVRALQL
jgi:hypothetical protein